MKETIKLWAYRALLSLVCLVGTAPAWAANMWILGDPAGGWAANKGYQMTQVSGTDNQYRAVLNMENNWRFSFTSSLGSNENDWSSMAGGRLCPSVNGQTISNGSYNFENYGWYTDNSFVMNGTTGPYKITLNSTTREMNMCPVNYTVAGALNVSNELEDASIFGQSWNPEHTANDMTFDGNNTWTKTYSKVVLTAGTLKFKVCENHAWTNAYPSSDYEIPVESGLYDIVITFNSNTCEVAATATKIPEVVYLFGSVGKSESWYYSDTNPKLLPDANYEYYTGVWDVNEMPSYTAREGQYGLFLLTTRIGTDWNSTAPYMIGTTSTDAHNHYWIDGGNGHYGEELEAIAGHTNGWTLPSGTYSFTYNRKNNWLKVDKYDGPVIYVYDYSRPYIYVRDGNGAEFNGAQPGAPILNLDESVGGHRGLSEDGDVTKDGVSPLGWYKFAVPSNAYPITFDLKHNGDNQVSTSEFVMQEGDKAFYCYWTGSEMTKFAQLTADDPNHLRRIVAHVRVQGTTVPTCDGVEMNGPSSFYGQMYYWMAVTTYQESFKFIISDGSHSCTVDAKSDFYIELGENGYQPISEQELEHRLANKTGRGTIIHLLKNNNTPVEKNGKVLGIDTEIHSGDYYNTTNQGATWWGQSLAGDESAKWKGTESHVDNGLSNYDNSRFIYMSNGVDGKADVYTINSEDGKEWYTWYSDRSTATIKFGYGSAQNGYPGYSQNNDVDKFNAEYESKSTQQTAGELWYVWTPDFSNTGSNNGELIDVTRSYESRAKQKAMCSTVRDGNFVYYTDIKGWDNICCYVWDKNGTPITPWPGVKMTKVGYDDEGHPVYLADLSLYDVTNAGGILFNDGNTNSLATDKRQTGDLEWENGGCYDYLGLLYRIGGNADVIENEPNDNPASLTLIGVWYSRVKGTLFAKTENDYNNKSVNGYGYTDYAKSTDLQSDSYDQSYWVEIHPSKDGLVNASMLQGLIDKKFTLYGKKISSVNPAFEAISVTYLEDVYDYMPNKFTPAHFMGMYQQCSNGVNYFFVEPKPNEFVTMMRAIFVDRDDATQTTSDGYNRFIMNKVTGLKGSFEVDWSYHDKNYPDGELVDGGVAPELYNLTGYENWLAIVKVKESTAATTSDSAPRRPLDVNEPFDPSAYDTSVAPSATYTVYPICINDSMITAIERVNGGKGELLRTRYYNLMGVESASPFDGVNIVVKEYSDGSRVTTKVIR